MKSFIWTRKVWKRVGISVLALFVILAISGGAFWLTYIHTLTPSELIEFDSNGATIKGK